MKKLNEINHKEHGLEKILVIGSGGRENALAWALNRSPKVKKTWITPGNAGSNELEGCHCLELKEDNVDGLIQFCNLEKIGLIVIGPEAPLAAGLADTLREEGFSVFGPGAEGAKLEASKTWSKQLMNEAEIPTARHWTASSKEEALKILNELKTSMVVKADGLAAGKGVTVANSVEETANAIKEVCDGRFGNAGRHILLEEKLKGPEVSIFALCDGSDMVLLPPVQDHKRLQEGDSGPNTGGMGAYAPAKLINDKDILNIRESILEPTLKALTSKGINYKGVIFAGLMLTQDGAKVIEFNCRFGDPECQALMPLMGIELAEVLKACADGKLKKAPNLSILNSCSACVVAAAKGYPKSPQKNDPIKIDKIHPNQSIQLFHAGTKYNSNGQLVTSGGRVLSVVAQAKDFDKAFTLAYERLAKVSFNGIYYRKDIGHQVRL